MTDDVRAGAFTLSVGAVDVEFRRDARCAEDGGERGRVIALSAGGTVAMSVEVRMDGRTASTAVLLCDLGCPAISESRTLFRGDTLFVAVRDQVAALAMPSLDLRWAVQLDDGCLFSLLEIVGEDAMLVHGELWITRLRMDGAIAWRRSGADIFTGSCEIQDDLVVAEDWNGAVYRWRLSDGQPVSTTPRKSVPERT